jgi:hypothetical protein
MAAFFYACPGGITNWLPVSIAGINTPAGTKKMKQSLYENSDALYLADKIDKKKIIPGLSAKNTIFILGLPQFRETSIICRLREMLII